MPLPRNLSSILLEVPILLDRVGDGVRLELPLHKEDRMRERVFYSESAGELYCDSCQNQGEFTEEEKEQNAELGDVCGQCDGIWDGRRWS